MPSEEKKKRDPRVIMGVCSALGFLAAGAYKVYTFGWDDVPGYWIWAGPVFIAAMIGVGFWLHARDRKALKAVIERGTGRARARESANESGARR